MLQRPTRLANLLVFSFALIPVFVFAQANFEGQVRGTIHDSSGSAVARAKITITDIATNISSATLSDDRGAYVFNGLRPATYVLKVEMAGFRPEEATNLVLGVSQHTSVEFSLQVAGIESSVTVLAAAPALDTGSAEIGTTVTGQYTRDMPLFGRSYFGLVFLSGGVTESAGSGMKDTYPSGTNFVSNGQRNSTAEVRSMASRSAHPSKAKAGTRMSTTHPPSR